MVIEIGNYCDLPDSCLLPASHFYILTARIFAFVRQWLVSAQTMVAVEERRERNSMKKEYLSFLSSPVTKVCEHARHGFVACLVSQLRGSKCNHACLPAFQVPFLRDFIETHGYT